MSSSLHRKRALLHGGNAAIFSIGAIGALVVGYILVDRFRPFRKDLTAAGLYSLSPKTVDMLKGIDKDVTVTYFTLPPSSSEQAGAVNQDVEDLLSEYKTRSGGKVTFTVANPLSDAEELERLGGDLGAAVFQSGDKKIVVEAKDISKMDYQTGEGMSFTGEEAFDSALLRLKEGKAQEACFLTGHGEPSIAAEGDDGFSLAKEFLRRENLDSKEITLAAPDASGTTELDKKLSLDKAPDTAAPGMHVPDDCTVLVIAGPQASITGPEADAIVKYWENGGGVVMLAEPLTHSGIEALASRFGVEIYGGVAADPQRKMRSPLAILPAYEHHEIVEPLASEQSPTLFVKAVGMKQAAKLPDGATATPLLQTSAAGVELVDIKDGTADAESAKNIKGPIELGFAIEKPGTEGKKPQRAVILGDSDFAGNAAMQAMAMKGAPGNIDLFKNAVDWTAGAKEKIGISPKTAEHHPVTITDRNAFFLLLGTGVFLPGLIFAGGITVWVRRRHR